MPRAGLNKEVIVKKAVELADTKGFSYITMKNMAIELNIKTPSLYNHIESQGALYQELMIYGWNEVSRVMHEVYEKTSGIEGVKELCRTFYHYALEHPGVYQAMMFYNSYSDERRNEISVSIFQDYYSIMKQLGFSEVKANHYLRTIRAFLDGYAALVFHNAFGHSLPVEESFEESLTVLVDGMLLHKD